MPLVSCPDCGHLISTEAQTCPNCGASVAGRTPSDSAAAIAPSGEPTASAYGRIRVWDAYRTGWDATWKYFGLWLGVGVVGVMLEVAAILTLVGIILVVPVLTWGVYRFVLNTIDGDPQFNDLFAGFRDYGLNLGRMLALMIIYGALAQIPQLFTPAVNDTAGTVLIGLALNLIAFLVSMRLVFAFFFVVDWREGPIQALKSSWAATGGQWLSVLAFNVVGVGVLLLGTLLFIVGFIPALMIFMASSAAVYRQMVPQLGRAAS